MCSPEIRRFWAELGTEKWAKHMPGVIFLEFEFLVNYQYL